jgi:hypothetical protein
MRGKAALLACVVATLFSAEVCASSSVGRYVFAHFSCAEFVISYSAETAARNAEGGSSNAWHTSKYAELYYYMAGWLSEYNNLVPDTNNIIPNGLNGAMLWVNNYCTANPLNDLEDALAALTVAAYPNRQR